MKGFVPSSIYVAPMSLRLTVKNAYPMWEINLILEHLTE